MMTTTKTAGIVIADFYQDISAALLDSCRTQLAKENVQCEVHSVAGALEIPPAINRLVSHNYYCFVALGCVIRGETYHFEVVANTSAAGILQLQLTHGIAIGNGILTVENKAQAQARANKGAEAAQAALQLAALS